MVRAVRRGSSLRRVAQRFGVSAGTVAYWVDRAAGQRLDRVDFSSRRPGRRVAANRTAARLERRVLAVRQHLKRHSPLGQAGAAAIRLELIRRQDGAMPTVRTINRILARHGLTDAHRRLRHPPPPKGWYLPDLAAGRVELDSFDTVCDLVIRGGQPVTVLNAISLHGGLPGSWPEAAIGAKDVTAKLLEHWSRWGRPGYAQFDNDTIFQGAHQFPDTFGRVTRLCLQLGVTPVFAPPYEQGFQAAIEAFNGRWERAVWQRWRHRNLAGLQTRSAAYLEAVRRYAATRIEAAPPRRTMPADFVPDWQAPLAGRVIYLRRTDPAGAVEVLGHPWRVDPQWGHRLVRVEVDLTAQQASFYLLRRREPTWQPRVRQEVYRPPTKRFVE